MSGTPFDGTAGGRRAWSWVAHLRSGGSTPWAAWPAEVGGGEPPAGGRGLPGAQQLELVRRLNAAGSPSPVLVERVLAASAPGRGRPDLELVGAVERPRFGPPPVDPADLPADELLRVAAGLVAEDLVVEAAAGGALEGPPPRRTPPLPLPWRQRYRLVGDPWLAGPLRSQLVARGRTPGGRGSLVLVLATDLPTMLTHAWAFRSVVEAGPAWDDWLGGVTSRAQVPPRADVVHTARTWAGRVGRDRVRVVLDTARVPGLLRVRGPLVEPPPVAADATDLARRVAAVLGLLALPAGRAELLRGLLLPRLAALPGAPAAPLVVPERHVAWVRRRAEEVRRALLDGGYPVVGDLDTLLPQDGVAGVAAAVTRPDEGRVLDLALRLLLDTDRASGVRPGPEEGER